jgi:hypothetical protein
MALPAFATVEELAAWLGTSIADDDPRATAILAASSTLIRSHSGRVWVDGDGPEEGLTETQQDSVKTVCLLVSARVWINPHGRTQEATGPFSHSVAGWAALGMELTETEKRMIGGSVSGIPGLSSVRVVAPIDASGSRHRGWFWDDDERCWT